MDLDRRRQYNEQFLRRLLARRPQDEDLYAKRLAGTRGVVSEVMVEGAPAAASGLSAEMVLETIVNEERPVLFVKNDRIDPHDATIKGQEARELVDALANRGDWVPQVMPLIGRFDVTNFPGQFVGTAWFVAEDIVVTNRHVASLIARWDGRKFAFAPGIAGRTITSSIDTLHEDEDIVRDPTRLFPVKEVLYIERDTSPNDIAFVRVVRRTDGTTKPFIEVSAADIAADKRVCVVGYPARAPRDVIPNQQLMRDLYLDRYDVKRIAPGYTLKSEGGSGRHDCTTLGGNSGSVVLDMSTGQAVGLHFAGLYQEANYAIRASVLKEYVTRKRWNTPSEIETRRPDDPSQGNTAAAVVGSSLNTTVKFSVTVPITITVDAGIATINQPPGPARVGCVPIDLAQAEATVVAFWNSRPSGVIAARVGFFDDGAVIGDVPFIAASVIPSRLADVAAKQPREFQGVEVRYMPAEVGEQVDDFLQVESVNSVAYDDDARTDPKFSFEPVVETMNVLMHVGPEYSWDTLKNFIESSECDLVSAMYEFHAPHIKDALEARLQAGHSLKLVLDNATFSKVRDNNEEFDRVEVFNSWTAQYGDRFQRIVAPEGKSGLISDSYHIKVTVREDDRFWLSSGNWKSGSSQPEITEEDRRDALEDDLPGNREWHVVIGSPTLARRFREHILQDYRRSADLGGGPVPRSLTEEAFVEMPLEETVTEERKPPSLLLEPKSFTRDLKVHLLLTPDRKGAVYSETILSLIRSAKRSLLFQIPYISMRSVPSVDRGFIDALLAELTKQLKTLDDARLLLRSGGSAFSSPTHAAWYFKSKGVDIARLRVIGNHHTKGMIVDGKYVLLGSHNWSKPGVTLNRDASLIFEDPDVAAYYGEAFEVDWQRANPIKPKRYLKPETVVGLDPNFPQRALYQLVPLSELAHD